MVARLVHFIRHRIAIKLTLTLVGFVGVSSLAAGLYLTRALEAFAVEALEARLVGAGRLLHDEAADLLRRGAPPAEARLFVLRAAEPTGSQVTVIAGDGRVLGDSQVQPGALAEVENHGDRPEVRTALAGGVGRDVRRSVTVATPLLYVAVPVGVDGRIQGVLRLALPLSVVTSSYAELHHAMWVGGLVALAVALGIGLFVAGRVTRPVVRMQAIARRMSEGDFGVRAPVRSPDEIGVLGRALNTMALRLRDKLDDLEHEQAKVGAILDGMVEGVIAVDARDHIVLMNERARAMLALGPARVEGKPLLEVIRNVELHRLFRDCRSAAEGVVMQRELSLADPSERTIQINAVRFRLAGDEPGAVAVLHEITELRRLEQVRTEFIANVSHELRTPLTAMQGYLETLLGGGLEDRENARRFLDIAFRHTERLGRLVNDLTDLSNIELGRVTLRLEPTPLGEVVESVLAIIRPRAEGGRVVLDATLPSGLPRVLADRDRLAQILINLVDNAVKYTPPEGRVTLAASAAKDGWVELSVTDTGVGIPASDLPRITERFYRVDKARSRELGGTGLGLAIVKHLVIAHGGLLRIDSELGRGTRVRVTLKTAEME
jgi:two-component system phosphate regulon sensor histidine kinase PhoR